MDGRSYFFAALLPALIGIVTPQWARAQWTHQVVEDAEEFELADTGLQVDAESHPHLFIGGDAVYHRWFDGAQWRREVVDATPRSGENLYAAIGPGGEFHLLYERFSPSRESSPETVSVSLALYHATNASGSWQVSVVPSVPGDFSLWSGAVRGIAVDPAGTLHALVLADPGMHHAELSAGGWSFERIDDASTGGALSATFPSSHSRLRADASGRLHAAWVAVGGRLVYSLRDARGWHHAAIDAVGAEQIDPQGDSISLVLDSSDVPHVVLIDRDVRPQVGTQLLSLRFAAPGWSSERITGPVTTFSVSAGPSGRLDAAWQAYESSSGLLRVTHARRETGEWSTDVASTTGAGDLTLALRVDAQGRAVAAIAFPGWPYYDGRLLFLAQSAGGWVSLPVAYSGPPLFSGSLSRPSSGAVFGADVRVGLNGSERRFLYRTGGVTEAGGLRHAAEAGRGFAVEGVPSDAAPGSVRSHGLAQLVTGNGAEYAVWINERVYLGTHTTGGWISEEIFGLQPGQGGVIDSGRPELRADGRGALHLLFSTFEGGNEYRLQRGSNATGRWVFEPLTQIGTDSFALAVEDNGAEHIAYVDLEGRVAYATNRTGTWQYRVIGGMPPSVYFGTHALLVEPDGSVLLAFERYQSGVVPGRVVPTGLGFGTNRCRNAWYVDVIDPRIDVENGRFFASRQPELALDSVGDPHVSYRRDADRSVAYARVRDGRWIAEVVTSPTYSGDSSGIALDDERRVSIAHHDRWAGGLSLSTRDPLPASPRWDGCPPLPDPDDVLQGAFVFETPPGAFPFYDPSASKTLTLGGVAFDREMELYGNGGSWVRVTSDLAGGEDIDLSGGGKGKLKAKKGVVRVSESIKLVNSGTHVPTSKLKLVRKEKADLATRTRVVSEKLRGAIDGVKVREDRQFNEPIPENELAIRLELSINASQAGALSVTGRWTTRGSVAEPLVGTGTWSPATSSAELELRGETQRGLEIALSGVRVHHSEADGVHLSAESASARGFGQTASADLSGAFATPTPVRAASPSAP